MTTITPGELFDMPLFSEVVIDHPTDAKLGAYVMRVPGGWIINTVFVPEPETQHISEVPYNPDNRFDAVVRQIVATSTIDGLSDETKDRIWKRVQAKLGERAFTVEELTIAWFNGNRFERENPGATDADLTREIRLFFKEKHNIEL